MAISYIGSTSAAGNTVDLPPHLPGDLILIHAYRATNSSAPVTAAEYTSINGGSVGTTSADRVGYRIALTDSEVSGVWTNAEALLASVYRGVDPDTPIGKFAIDTNTGAAGTTYPALTTADTSGQSWIVEFAGVRSGGQSVQVPPVGMTNRVSQIINAGQSASHDSNGGIKTIAAAKAGGTGFRYRCYAIEIKAAAVVTESVYKGASTQAQRYMGSRAAAVLYLGARKLFP